MRLNYSLFYQCFRMTLGLNVIPCSDTGSFFIHKCYSRDPASSAGWHYDYNFNLRAPRIYFNWKIPHQPLAKQSTGLFCSTEWDDIKYSAKWIFTQRKTDLKFPWGLLKFTLYFLVSFSEIMQLLRNVFCHLFVVYVYHLIFLDVVVGLDLESFVIFDLYQIYQLFHLFVVFVLL